MGGATMALVCGLIAVQADPGIQTDPSRDRARREPTQDTGLVYHLTWYGADYAAIAALLGFNAGLLPLVEPGPALWGPSFDDDKPDFSAFEDPRDHVMTNKPFRDNTVPDEALWISGVSLAATAMGYDAIRHTDAHRAHNLLLAGVEAMVVTYTVTEALKLGVGRLRPDFQDRATRYYCNPDGGDQRTLDGLDCSQVDRDGEYLVAKDMRKGHRSFPSGHSSSSFALAVFFSLYVGGETIWGQHATETSVPIGAAMMAGLMGAAATVAASRISDGRHHYEDVAAGAALGTAASALFYFLHFDTKGRATYRGISVAPVALNEGMALQLAWAL